MVGFGGSFWRIGGRRLVGVGGTGRASCASRFGTNGRLGVEAGGVVVVVVGSFVLAQAVF